VQPEEPMRIGRISLPFLLRARADVKLDGTPLGLRQGRHPEKTVGQFFEEERMKRGTGAAGQY
jgi:hypothetical protein